MNIVGKKGKWGLHRVLEPLLILGNWNMEIKGLRSFTECLKFGAPLYSRNISHSRVHFPLLVETLFAIGFYATLTLFFFYLMDYSLPSLPCRHYCFWFTLKCWRVLFFISLLFSIYTTSPGKQIHLHCFKVIYKHMNPDSLSLTWTFLLRYIFIIRSWRIFWGGDRVVDGLFAAPHQPGDPANKQQF